MLGRLPPRTMRAVAWGYLLKSLLVGLAWLAIPDLPQKTADLLRQAFHSSADED